MSRPKWYREEILLNDWIFHTFLFTANRRATDIMFEHEEEELRENDPTYATETLKRLVRGTMEEIQMETPQLFSQFVGALRKLNNESIHELYERAINCPLYYMSCQNNEPKMNLIK